MKLMMLDGNLALCPFFSHIRLKPLYTKVSVFTGFQNILIFATFPGDKQHQVELKKAIIKNLDGCVKIAQTEGFETC